jgi:hypothetical protein
LTADEIDDNDFGKDFEEHLDFTVYNTAQICLLSVADLNHYIKELFYRALKSLPVNPEWSNMTT